MTATGNIMLGINAGTVLTATGGGNTASNSASVFYDIDPPVAVMVNPGNGAAISTTTLNSQKYIDIAYSANVGAGLSTASILNKTPKFTLTGTAATGVKITLPPTKQAGTDTYRYFFTGSFGVGTVTVNFIANTVEDNAGNWNKAASFSFNVMQGLSVNSLPTITKATSGTTNAVFTVSLSSAATKAVSVRYTTTNGTGVAGVDYKAVSGTLTFAAGQTSKTVAVPIIGNKANKVVAFNLVLSAPTNAVINKSTGTCTIYPPAASPKSATPASKSRCRDRFDEFGPGARYCRGLAARGQDCGHIAEPRPWMRPLPNWRRSSRAESGDQAASTRAGSRPVQQRSTDVGSLWPRQRQGPRELEHWPEGEHVMRVHRTNEWK